MREWKKFSETPLTFLSSIIRFTSSIICDSKERQILMFRIFSFLVTILAVTSCSDASPPESYSVEEQRVGYVHFDRVDFSTLSFVGTINKEVSAELNSIQEEFSVLEITSHGGDMMAAIDMAMYLDNHEITVQIKDYCFSACAHFIAVPVDRVIIEGQAIIAFHHTSSTILYRAARPIMLHPERFKELWGATASEQIRFYYDQNIDQRWLVEPDIRTNPVCTYLGVVQDTKFPIVNYRNGHDYFVPTYSLLGSMNPNRVVFSFERELYENELKVPEGGAEDLQNLTFLLSDDPEIYASEEDMARLQRLPYC